MLFQVTNIRLDFTGSEDEITLDEQIDIQDDITNTIWEADDEDDLSRRDHIFLRLVCQFP